jgi:hypothetical protein
MNLTLDGVVAEEQPTTLSWSNPRQLGFNGLGAPVYGPYRTCSLGFERMTLLQFHQWWEASEDGELHNVLLPHPQSGLEISYSVYVSQFAPRMNTRDDCDAAAAGVDIRLTRAEVT